LLPDFAQAQNSPREIVDEFIVAYNNNDVDSALPLLSSDFARYSNTTRQWQPMAVDQWAAMWRSFGVAFPDIRWEVQSITAEGDLVVVEVIEKGTFKNTWELPNHYKIKPSGKSYESRNAIAFYVRDGQIVKYHQYAGLGFLSVGLNVFDMIVIMASGF